LQDGAPIDGFGIGTHMNTSADAPYLDCAYKLVEYAGLPRHKRSPGKATWPGRKQVFRHYDSSGIMRSDTLALHNERLTGSPQLRAVMRDGKIIDATSAPTLAQIRAYAQKQLAALPAPLRRLTLPAPQAYPVSASESLKNLLKTVDERQRTLAAIDMERWGDEVG
jgi:nicotinate phosphoribosyltransferase